jgi:4-aminobutyrate aminotransferase/(S)-3-amino-2-methylpropionate transaminase
VEARYISRSIITHFPVVLAEGKGATIRDVDGNQYIDFTSGVLVSNTGHSHPKVVRAVQRQAERLLNCFDIAHDLRYKLLEVLASITPGNLKKFLLVNTGAEAVESAVKLARFYKRKHEIISFHGAFHGRTHLALSLSGLTSYHKQGFGPSAVGILHAPYAYCYRCSFKLEYPSCGLCCVDYLEHVVAYESVGDVAAVVVEPIQGTSGAITPPDEYFPKLKKFCEEHDMLLIIDEVQTGFGRTGKMFAIEHWGVIPDIICVAKGIASGVPMGAMIAPPEIMDSWGPGKHTSTFGGNPLACAAALASIEVLLEEELHEKAKKMGNYMMKRLNNMSSQIPIIGEVRGKGLSIGVELVTDRATKNPAKKEAEEVVSKCFKRGLLMYTAGFWSNTLRIVPPLTITSELADKALAILEKSLKEVGRKAHE